MSPSRLISPEEKGADTVKSDAVKPASIVISARLEGLAIASKASAGSVTCTWMQDSIVTPEDQTRCASLHPSSAVYSVHCLSYVIMHRSGCISLKLTSMMSTHLGKFCRKKAH